MEALLIKVGNVLADQGLAGVLIVGSAYWNWWITKSWISEAQKRAAADLEDARSKEAVASSLGKLSEAIRELTQETMRPPGRRPRR